jgi:predicted Zn-dependent protease with MMP-like domain
MPKRRRGSRHATLRRRATRHVPFAMLVDRAVAGIPSPFREALDEIAIVVADEPTRDQLRENGLALEADFPDPDDLADEVRITILHELAHHLGIEDEDRLHHLGID